MSDQAKAAQKSPSLLARARELVEDFKDFAEKNENPGVVVKTIRKGAEHIKTPFTSGLSNDVAHVISAVKKGPFRGATFKGFRKTQGRKAHGLTKDKLGQFPSHHGRAAKQDILPILSHTPSLRHSGTRDAKRA